MSSTTYATIEVVGLAMLGGAIGCFFTLFGVVCVIFLVMKITELLENLISDYKEKKEEEENLK